jgi:DNA-directed RNA polymerase subunit H (RpoH/RPB5)
MDEHTIRNYHLSYTNMLKVIKYRGYIVDKTDEISLDEFTELYSELTIEEMKGYISELVFKNSKNITILKWITAHKLGTEIRNTITEMSDNDAKIAIVVVDGGITASCRDIIKSVKKTKGFIIDVWTLQQSMVFVPEHVLVPPHRICSFAEKKELFKSCGIALKDGKKKIPLIKNDDVMVKYLGAKPNDLIEIIRPSETDPNSTIKTFRIVT